MGKRHKKAKKKPQTTWGKIWYFIWEDDSLLSWLVNIVLAFILIKFLVYPGLGVVFGTSYPIVAVVSGSMYHGLENPCEKYDLSSGMCVEFNKNKHEICGVVMDEKIKMNYGRYWDICGKWYVNNVNISKNEFNNFSMHNGFAKGDIIFLRGIKPEKVDVGDIIVFNGNKPYPIIHRVVTIEENNGEFYFTTKGDHNQGSGSFEKRIESDKLIGKAMFKVPFLGYVKILVVDLIKMVI